MYQWQVVIEGNLTQDPEITVLASGKSVCRFSIATNRYYRNAEKAMVSEVTYVDIDTWGALAEGCSKYLHKGRGARIVGRLKQERWQGDDSRMHERYVVVAEHVEFHPESQRENPAPVTADCATEAEEDTTTEQESMVFEEPPKSRKAKHA